MNWLKKNQTRKRPKKKYEIYERKYKGTWNLKKISNTVKNDKWFKENAKNLKRELIGLKKKIITEIKLAIA